MHSLPAGACGRSARRSDRLRGGADRELRWAIGDCAGTKIPTRLVLRAAFVLPNNVCIGCHHATENQPSFPMCTELGWQYVYLQQTARRFFGLPGR